MSRARFRGLPVALLVWGLFGHGGCYRAQIDIADGDAGATEPACDSTPLSSDYADCHGLLPDKQQCSVPDPNGWNGCYDGGCTVCSDVLQAFPFYFAWHPCCQPNDFCTSELRGRCNERCPAPGARDQVKPCWSRTPNL
ncbi:MAG: hypothetical protein ABJB12_16870 [Pseudomonadota bacterium]